MSIHVELSARTFAVLEKMPENNALDLFRLIDRLRSFPELGTPLDAYFPGYHGFRQLIYKRQLRVIYEYIGPEKLVKIHTILDCRQELPDRRELTRDVPPNEELPLE
jgi:plasmid stabilization system protein ParE